MDRRRLHFRGIDFRTIFSGPKMRTCPVLGAQVSDMGSRVSRMLSRGDLGSFYDPAMAMQSTQWPSVDSGWATSVAKPSSSE